MGTVSFAKYAELGIPYRGWSMRWGNETLNGTETAGDGYTPIEGDDMSAEAERMIAELHKTLIVPGQGYSYANAANVAASTAADALVKPSSFSAGFRPIDVLVSQVPAILKAVSGGAIDADAIAAEITAGVKEGIIADVKAAVIASLPDDVDALTKQDVIDAIRSVTFTAN
jgi:hypothetical protein